MIGESRAITNFEKGFIRTNERMQFALIVNDKSLIQQIAESFKKEIIAFRLKVEGDRLITTNDEPKIYSLPKEVESAQEAASFIGSIPLDFSKSLGILAIGENSIAVSTSHMVTDGGFFVELFNRTLSNLSNLTNSTKTVKIGLPRPAEKIFEKQFSLIKGNLSEEEILKQAVSSYNVELATIPHCRWSDSSSFKSFLKSSFLPSSLLYKYQNADKSLCSYFNFENPANEFEFFRSKTGLSESYWTMWPLSLLALDNGNSKSSTFSRFGVSTCVDLRGVMRELGLPVDHTVGNNFIDLNVCINSLNDNFEETDVSKKTVREVGQLLRKTLNTKRTNNHRGLFDAYNSMRAGFSLPEGRETVTAEISNIGRFDLKPPLLDCWVEQTMKSEYASGFSCISAFSKNKFGVNTIVTRFQKPPTISDVEGNLLVRGLLHGMKNIPVDVTMETAVEEISRFQSQLRKEITKP